ncbi:hypothetical protein WA026_008674 [Henosepilachna vigintioctopunctata]|uniref:Uncharacterized protein n=1 Tax=Henosepilachna vigintioctopunctata TaxID=420089 RepID=A0AAW1V2G5_9CUCU
MADESMESKYKSAHQKISADVLRSKLRQKLMTSLQEARNKNIDSKRFLNSSSSSKSQIAVKSTQDVREMFMDNKELRHHISPDEMDELFRKIEQEFCFSRNELYLQEMEIDAIISSLLHDCLVCGNFNANLICPSCASQHFSDS